MKLTPFKLDVASGVVEIAAAWQPIIEQCCELKEAIDHASRWRCDTPWKQAVEKILKQHDLAITDIPSHSELNCNFPDHFARLMHRHMWSKVFRYSWQARGKIEPKFRGLQMFFGKLR